MIQVGTSRSAQQYKLRKLIAALSSREAKGKEFVSLYLTPGRSIEEMTALIHEQLKSREARRESEGARIDGALSMVLRRLKSQKETSAFGLAMFAGTYSTSEGRAETENVLEIVPPEPITKYQYEVDDHFDLEPLREMLRGWTDVGIIAIDSKEAGYGVVRGTRVDIVEDITSGIPGKSGKGGQSQRRYERERDMELTYYFHRVGEHATKTLLEEYKVTGLIVGGPGQTKGDFLKGDYLHYELKRNLLSTVDTLSSGKEGVKEVGEKAPGILRGLHDSEERKLLQRLLADLGRRDGLAISGLEPVLNAIRDGVAEVALVSDNVDMVRLDKTCRKCSSTESVMTDRESRVKTEQGMISTRCGKCGAGDYEVEEKDIVDVLEDAASQTDARVEVIAAPDGTAKLGELGGVAALLRYRQG